MSNAPEFQVKEVLGQLVRLRESISAFAQREEALNRDLRTRLAASQRRQRDGITVAESQHAEELSAAKLLFEEAKDRVTASNQRRAERIRRAEAQGVRQIERQGQRLVEKLHHQLQMRHLQIERGLPTALQREEKQRAALVADLATEAARLPAYQTQIAKAFAGFPAFRRLLQNGAVAEEPAGASEELFTRFQSHLDAVGTQLDGFRQIAPVKTFRNLLVTFLAGILPAAAALWMLRSNLPGMAVVAATLGGVLIATVLVRRRAAVTAEPLAAAMTADFHQARSVYAACLAAAQSTYDENCAQLRQTHHDTCAEIEQQWEQAHGAGAELAREIHSKIQHQAPRAAATNAARLPVTIQRLRSAHEAATDALNARTRARIGEITAAYELESAALSAEESSRWATLQNDWQADVCTKYEVLRAMDIASTTAFPPWSAALVDAWAPPEVFAATARFGRLAVNLAGSDKPFPKDSRLALPGPAEISAPLALSFPARGALLFETRDSGDPTIIGALNNIILRLFSSTPPGKLSVTIIDPVGLGQNFAGLMAFGDYEESLINRRIWTQRDQIEERLAELNEHLEKVIQMYLRNDFATITEYNAEAGSVAEKYHFLVVVDFPAGFSETAAKRLQSIAVSGPRCGVFTLLHWDRRQPLPDGVAAEELHKNPVLIQRENGAWLLDPAQPRSGAELLFDMPPAPELATALIAKIGKSSIDSNRVQVPFSQIAPAELWTGDTSSELRVAVGRTGATKLQYLAIGKGTRQHALFAGKTGSGKSTLFHVIITNLALTCSPEQVEFYLIDFKKGVEFKCYAESRLPHARVVAIESDREFALSVLQRVDEELKRRGDLFRRLGVQDVAGFIRAGGNEPMPRSLLIIDEFQEFFVEDDEIAQNASVLFDRIVRQGRAFGIHVLLGSQTLGGAYTLARATLGQMVIRVALQCNEADAYLIMDDNNSAPRLLSRPGEGIYNDAAGAIEGNSPFQVVWFSDEERDEWLEKINALAAKADKPYHGPIVFEGNAPADIRENHLLEAVLANPRPEAPDAGRCWLGAPNSIKSPTEVVFERQSGNHLLIVGQRDEAALTLLGLSLFALGAQYPVDGARFVFIHAAAPGSQDALFLSKIVGAGRHAVTITNGPESVGIIKELAGELAQRSGAQNVSAPPVYVFIHGLHRFKKLRQEDDFSFSSSSDSSSAGAGAQLLELITEGSAHGIHLLVSIDSFNNVNRAMSRKALSEFEMRVVFQMSGNDSASLIDSTKASGLGLHRALFCNEQQGVMETFRPYAAPDSEFFARPE